MQAVVENNSLSTPVHSGIVVDVTEQPETACSESIDTVASSVTRDASIFGPATRTPELLTHYKAQELTREASGEAPTQNPNASGTLVQLEELIKNLWSAHRLGEDKLHADEELLSAHKTKCVAVRLALEQSLHTYKGRLVGKGRDGRWSKFLRDAKISKTTADRYVQRWAERLKPKKLVSDELLQHDEIAYLALLTAKKLKSRLKTRASIETFLRSVERHLLPFAEPRAEESASIN